MKKINKIIIKLIINSSPTVSSFINIVMAIGGYDPGGGSISVSELYLVYKVFLENCQIDSSAIPISLFPLSAEILFSGTFKTLQNVKSVTKNKMTSFIGISFKDPCFYEFAKFLNSASLTSIEALNKSEYLFARCMLYLYSIFSKKELIEFLGTKIPEKQKLEEIVKVYQKEKQVPQHLKINISSSVLEALPIQNQNLNTQSSLSFDPETEDPNFEDELPIEEDRRELNYLLLERQSLGRKNDEIETKLI